MSSAMASALRVAAGRLSGCAVFGGGGHGEVGEGGEKHFAGHSVEIASDGDSSVEGGGDAQFVAVGVFAWWWVVGFEHVLEDADGVAQFDGGCFDSGCCGEECVAAVRKRGVGHCFGWGFAETPRSVLRARK